MPAAKLERPPHLPHGRWLGDFPDLSDVEKRLVKDCAAGTICKLGTTRPETATAANTIRAALIRFLALGGDDTNPVHEIGVHLVGAWIMDKLDLNNVTAKVDLLLVKCSFCDAVKASDAKLVGLYLDGSQLPGLTADRLIATGAVHLRAGFKSLSEVRLLGARIGDNLDCSGGSFVSENPLGNALSADGMIVAGNVILANNFVATGQVRLLGARISGNLDCGGGCFTNYDPNSKQLGKALSADRVVVKGDVFLVKGFAANGEVRLLGARIGGTLSCNKGCFTNKGEENQANGVALSAEGMMVKGGVDTRHATFEGTINLSAAHAESLIDDNDCWPDQGLILDGFEYHRIVNAPTDAETRIRWLKMQIPPHLGEDFRPQPWEQLIIVLRVMGHSVAAAEIGIAKQRALREAGKIGNRIPRSQYFGWRLGLDSGRVKVSNWIARRWHWVYGALAGFGYRPARILLWMIGLCLLSGWYFSNAASSGIMAPTSAEIFAHKQIHADLGAKGTDGAACGIQREVPPARYWTQCSALPSEYTTFNPWIYSLDLILPLVDLQQDSQWAPSATYTDAGGVTRNLWGGMIARFIMWFEILFGWFASLMFVAIAGRLVEKD